MTLRMVTIGRGWAGRLAPGLILVGVLCLASATSARAQKMEIVLKDGLWGAALGALIGTAQVLLLDEPEKELHRIPAATAVGAILGVAFGFLEVSGAFAYYDAAEHRLVLGPPMPRFEFTPEGRRTRLDLFETRF